MDKKEYIKWSSNIAEGENLDKLAIELGSIGHADWAYIPVEWSRSKYG